MKTREYGSTKICAGCGKRKALREFYPLRKGDERRQARCKPCDNAARVGRQYDERGVPAVLRVRLPGQIGDAFEWTRAEAWEAVQTIRRALRGNS